MSSEEFIKFAKSGNATVQALDVVVSTGQTELKGSGLLEFSRGSFLLKFTCCDGEPPELPNIIHREHFWKVTGKFPSGLRFTCLNVPPPSSWKWRLGESQRACAFKLESIELEADGFEALSYDELEDAFRQADRVGEKLGHQPIESQRVVVRRSGTFHILLPECALLFGTEEIHRITKHPFLGESWAGVGRVLQGALGKFEYSVSDNDGDLAIDIRSKIDETTNEGEDRRFCDAMLETVCFTHGVQVRPFHTRYCRDHKLVENCFRPLKSPVRTSNIPFPETLCISGAFEKAAFKFKDAFEIILKFFFESDPDTEIRDYLAELQLTAVEGMNPSHARLAVCRIFEGVTSFLFEELKLKGLAKNLPAAKSFEEAKATTVKWLSENTSPGFDRVLGVVQSANPLRIAEKYEALLLHFGVTFEGIPKQILSDWDERRNPLAHGRSDIEGGNVENVKAWFAQSRIAGGVLLLILKRMGYKGKMRISSLENTYLDI